MEEIKELEIGEYVRDKNGNIDKIENYSLGCCVWHCVKGMCIDRCNTVGTHLTDIVKHSKNIKELVEAGDVIKYKINSLRVELGKVEKYTDARSFKEYLGVNGCSLEEVDILEILTKEKFESECFKVEV